MFQFVRRWHRDLLRDQIINNGKKLRRYQAARAEAESEDCAILDAMIDQLERRHRVLLRKFKEAQ